MSGNAMWHAMSLATPLSPNERLVLATLAYYAAKDQNFSSPAMKTLKSKTGLSQHYLKQALSLLVDRRLLSITRRRDPLLAYKNTSSVYLMKFMPEAKAGTVEADGVDIFRIRATGRV